MKARMLPVVIAVLLVFAAACDDKTPRATPNGATSAPAITTGVPSAAPVASAAPPSSAPIKVPDAIAAQHVLVAFKGAKNADKKITRSKADAKKRAEDVVTKARSGSDFSALIAEYTDDAATKDRQGSLGKFTRDKMTKAFGDTAFALAVDQVSDPVETEFGFHVIKRNQ